MEDYILNDRFRRFLDAKVIEFKPGFARVEGIVKEEFTNIHGFCHGGYLISLADFALGLAANSDGVKRFAISISMDFFTPAFIGDKLIAEAKVVKAGKRISFYEMVILKGDEVIAKGNAVVYSRGEKIENNK